MLDEGMVQSVREVLDAAGCEDCDVEERNMMGGACFMVRGNMCMGVVSVEKGGYVMCRVGEKRYAHTLTWPGVTEMNFTGRPMRGFVYVDPKEVKRTPATLDACARECLEFNAELPPSAGKTRPKSNAKAKARARASASANAKTNAKAKADAKAVRRATTTAKGASSSGGVKKPSRKPVMK